MASNRLDSVIAAMSRKIKKPVGCADTIPVKIFINGAECLHNTYLCKQNDVISIRGTGKFIFDGEIGTTKKSKIENPFPAVCLINDKNPLPAVCFIKKDEKAIDL